MSTTCVFFIFRLDFLLMSIYELDSIILESPLLYLSSVLRTHDLDRPD